ncbi:MAG: hypothetical protein AB1324_05705 [Candidatus Micrarchaeota archaeon]
MQHIVPLGVRAGYPKAWQLAEFRRMKLPPHPLHDDYLARSDRWKTLGNYRCIWAREILVYPESGGVFQKGRDVVDAETGWTMPADYVAKAAEGKELFGAGRAGLFVEPAFLEEADGRVVVHPASLLVLHGVLQLSGFSAKVDERTRIPLRLENEDVLPGEELRCLWRISGAGVRPLSRAVSSCSNEQRFNQVFADTHPETLLDVTGAMEW